MGHTRRLRAKCLGRACAGDFGLPHAGLEDLSHLVLPAGGMALVAFCDTMANARSYAAAGGYGVSGERELAALGAADVVAGLSQGFLVSSSGSRTAVGEEAGGRSQLVGLSVAVLVAVFAAVGTPLIQPLPTAVLSAVVAAAAMNQLSVRRIRGLRMVHDSEAALAVAAMVGVIALGVLNGLGVAVLLSIGLFVHRSVRPHDAVLGKTPDLDRFHDIEVHEQVETVPGLIVYRFDAPLFFPNAPLLPAAGPDRGGRRGTPADAVTPVMQPGSPIVTGEVIKRLRHAEGQLHGVIAMLESRRDRVDAPTLLAAAARFVGSPVWALHAGPTGSAFRVRLPGRGPAAVA
ncbi:metal-sensing transcriptional repressor [Streptomyces sp. NPDC020192]|uniref:metal-sensing transcriptional repressor n=1 Tax=Streptomyces sp. NPDC020192 TaxID=3365066 RepID=UPI003788FEAA